MAQSLSTGIDDDAIEKGGRDSTDRLRLRDDAIRGGRRDCDEVFPVGGKREAVLQSVGSTGLSVERELQLLGIGFLKG